MAFQIIRNLMSGTVYGGYFKTFLTYTIAFCTAYSVFGQPVPCGPVPDMTSTCIEACVICDIDGYTGINNDTEQGEAPPGFCTNTVHHMQWIAFIAGSVDLTITVTPSNCNTGDGLEVGIYESLDCNSFNLVSNCNGDIAEGQVGVFSNTEPLVIGQYYYFVMDGNKGDICNYTIHVTQGSTLVPPLPNAGPVEGPDKICQADTATYSIPPITGANFYEWRLDGNLVANGPESSIEFPNAGFHQVCVTAFNVCDTVPPSCKSVEVLAPQTTNLQFQLCSSDCVTVADSMLCAPGNYTFLLSSIYGCDSTVNVAITQLPAVQVSFSATICSTDSLLVGTTWYHPPGQFTEMLQAQNGCDSTIQLTLQSIICEIKGKASIQPILCHGAATGQLTFSIENGTPPFTFSWERLGGSPFGSGTLSALNTDVTISNLPPGTYLVSISDGFGNDAVLTANIEEPPPLSIGLQAEQYNGYGISCFGGQNGKLLALPTGGVPGYTYAWSTGETLALIDSLGAGDYAVTITDIGGCTVAAQITLASPPPLTLSARFFNPTCDGEQTGVAQVDSVFGGVSPYLYALGMQDLVTDPVFTDLSPGAQMLTVVDANGCAADTTAILIAAAVPYVELGDDVEIELGDGVTIQAVINLIPMSVLWSPPLGLSCLDCLEPVAMPVNTTVYTLTVSSEDGCSVSDSLRIVLVKGRKIYIPNAISPKDDGLNSRLTVYTDQGASKIQSLLVYSRWGELLFESYNFPPNDLNYGWNGRFRGKEMPAGVYVWRATIEFLDGVVVEKTGDVTIVR